MGRAVFEPLSRGEEDQVHAESIRILEQVGIKVTSGKVLAMLAEHGATVDARTQVAKIPEDLVDRALSKVKKEFSMCGRDPSVDAPLPVKDHAQAVNDGQPTEVWDVDGQRKRKSTISDLVDFTILCDAMPECEIYWAEVVANDVPAEVSNVHEYAASLFYTGKHVQHGSGDPEEARFLIKIAAAAAGGLDQLRKRPIISITHTPITPLRYESGDIESVLEFSKAGLPVVNLSMAISGSVCPVTLAGTVALVNAENLGGLVMEQIAAPGCPVLYSSESGPMDMRSGVFLSGSTEGALINAAGCQMARRYGLPSQVGGIAASGTMPGYEIGYQKAISALLPVLAGADQVVGLGGFHRSGCESLEQVVMDCELWRNVLRGGRGVKVDEESLGFEAIARVGPGGYFMKDIHTLKHFKEEVLLPKIAMRDAPPSAQVEPIRSLAKDEVKRILKEHRPVQLDRSVKQEIKKLVAEWDVAKHGAVVPTKYLDRFR